MLGRALSSTGSSPEEGLGNKTPEQYASDLGIVSKHSLEGIAARQADVFTTVSEITAREAEVVHLRRADPLLPNGIDLGVIDLRDTLVRHRLILRAAEGAPAGEVRVAMCFGPPPVGPGGERIALGSRQFPPVTLGSEVEWLLPHEAHSVFFLVERPRGSPDGGTWRTGRQRLFGPFTSATLPTELIMD